MLHSMPFHFIDILTKQNLRTSHLQLEDFKDIAITVRLKNVKITRNTRLLYLVVHN